MSKFVNKTLTKQIKSNKNVALFKQSFFFLFFNLFTLNLIQD